MRIIRNNEHKTLVKIELEMKQRLRRQLSSFKVNR